MSMDLTEALADFLIGTPSEKIPAAAYDNAEKAIVDTIGCILAGSVGDVGEPLRRYLATSEGEGNRPVLGTGKTAPPEIAAMINGTFGHALDFDDVLSMMPAHPSTVILPALFACLGKQASGQSLLESYILGVEVGAKIGLGIGHGHYRRGWHATGTLAIFSAIAALARLLDLDVPTTRQAFGVGASMASGLQCNFGTMTKPFHAGWASRSAVAAVRLAEAGFSASATAMEAKNGFFSTYGTDQSDMARCIAGLGQPFVLVDPGLALKKYPCCYALHRPIDGLLDLRERLSLTPETTDTVHCRVAPGALRPLPYDRPVTGLEGKFSMEYTLAAGVLDGRFDLAAFSDDGVTRPGIADLLPRMHKEEDPRCLGDDPDPGARSSGTIGFVEVTATRRDGVSETVRVDKPTGSPERELSWDDLESKFHDCAAQTGMTPAAAASSFADWRDLRRCDDVATLLEPLSGSAA
ncbi:MAG: MmgE/PrpD family protein [Alphaproteobacteria bacterium]|nr:MmgE/PrpD family protein [Alphaproteobacteria bacterium]